MEMYYYALLTEHNTCHSIIECSEERSDIDLSHIRIDSSDKSILNALWTGSEWELPPSDTHRWYGSEWVDILPPIGENDPTE